MEDSLVDQKTDSDTKITEAETNSGSYASQPHSVDLDHEPESAEEKFQIQNQQAQNEAIADALDWEYDVIKMKISSFTSSK